MDYSLSKAMGNWEKWQTFQALKDEGCGKDYFFGIKHNRFILIKIGDSRLKDIWMQFLVLVGRVTKKEDAIGALYIATVNVLNSEDANKIFRSIPSIDQFINQGESIIGKTQKKNLKLKEEKKQLETKMSALQKKNEKIVIEMSAQKKKLQEELKIVKEEQEKTQNLKDDLEKELAFAEKQRKELQGELKSLKEQNLLREASQKKSEKEKENRAICNSPTLNELKSRISQETSAEVQALREAWMANLKTSTAI